MQRRSTRSNFTSAMIPKPVPSASTVRQRFAIAFFVLSAVSLVAPVYTAVGNRVEPRVLGLPFSLVYVLAVIAIDFVVLAWMYRKGVGR